MPSVLVVVGWFIVNKTQANRERRKQLRDTVSNLQDALTELEKGAIKYHTSTRQRTHEMEIITTLGRFEILCSTLPRYAGKGRFLKACPPSAVTVSAEAIQKFRQALTLSHFADEHFVALSEDDELIAEIQGSCSLVYTALENVRIAALD